MTEAKADDTVTGVPAGGVVARHLPGEQLRRAREAQAMSVTDVADVLRFSERQIEALEAGDYDALPGVTVVRGFIRAYAKLLKLDPAPLLAALAADVPVDSIEVRPPANMGQAEDAPLLGASVPWGKATGGLVLLAALVAGGYYLSASLPLPESSPSATAIAPPVAVAVTPPAPVIESAAGTPTPVASSVTAVVPSANALILEFDDASWVEIRDAGKKVLLSGEFPKGTRQVVEGRAPFQVWVGKASGVRVHYGERTIDLKPHTHEDVARLSVE